MARFCKASVELNCDSIPKEKSYDKAATEHTKIIELKPDDYSAYSSRGLCFDYLGDKDKAAADRKKYDELYNKQHYLEQAEVMCSVREVSILRIFPVQQVDRLLLYHNE
jgi:hypothetical protein